MLFLLITTIILQAIVVKLSAVMLNELHGDPAAFANAGDIARTIAQLSEAYGIDKDAVVSIVELIIRESIFAYFGKDSQVCCDDGEIKIYVYDGDGRFQPFDLNKASKDFIVYLKKRLVERFSFEKASRKYHAVKRLRRALVGGYPVGKANGYYLVKLTDMPFDVKGVMLDIHAIPGERLKLFEYYFFTFLKAKSVQIGLKYDLAVYLSRTSIRLPELLLQKAVEENAGVNIDCRCVKRVAGRYSIIQLLETRVKIPKKVISYVQENLNNEKVIIKVVKRR